MPRRIRPRWWLLTLAAILRSLGIALSTLQISPYALHDATKFAAHARHIAMTTLAGHPQTGPLFWSRINLLAGMVRIYDLWGLALSPAYLLWGPSDVYARFALATLGVLAVWNVFELGREMHSRWTGLIAAFPIAVYPSAVLMQSTLLRESAVLFLLTSIARLAIAPPRRFGRLTRLGLGVVCIIVAGLLRWELFLLVIPTLAVGAVGYLAATATDVCEWSTSSYAGVIVLAAPVVYGAWLAAERAARYLSHLRKIRGHGRTAYLASAKFPHVGEMAAFTPIAVAYFLFVPFPWMIGAFSDVVVALEGVSNIVFALAGVAGAYTLATRWGTLDARCRAGWLALAVWLIAGSVLFGLGTANVGTAVRHRQMFVWAMYLFAGVGFMEWLPSEWTARSPFETTS